MLFQKLYNWIKYKTLPPSVLFKNRLFVERDSKNRRILSNFGLSFRNSKWTNYETSNIKSQFRSAYNKYFYNILFYSASLFILWYFNKLYLISDAFNLIYVQLWFSIDAIDYCITFFVWLFVVIVSSIFKLINYFFFFNNFSNNESETQVLATTDGSKKNDIYISKEDLRMMTHAWLLSTKASKDPKILEEVFQTTVSPHWWEASHDLTTKLQKTTLLLNSLSEDNSKFANESLLNSLDAKTPAGGSLNTASNLANSDLLNDQVEAFLSYAISDDKNYFDLRNQNSPSLRILKSRFDWNLVNLDNELARYEFLLKTKSGLFYMNDFSYKQFSNLTVNFNELWGLNFFLKNQLSVSKWNRWLYKYSILHRKIFKNSHKLTITKRLLGSGFYENKIFDKNIWAVANINKFQSNDKFSALFNNMYPNLFKTSLRLSNSNQSLLSPINSNLQQNVLLYSNFYETSYFWYLKRFYFLNTLATNVIKSSSRLITQNNEFVNKSISVKNKNFDQYELLSSYLLKSSILNFGELNHSGAFTLDISNFDTFNKFNNPLSANFIFSLKDLYLLNSENDLFSRDSLTLLYWITTPNLDNNNNIVFFNYLNFMTIWDFNKSFFYSDKPFCGSSNNFIYFLTYSLIDLDRIYLTDVAYLSLFY